MPVNGTSPLEDPDVVLSTLHHVGLAMTGMANAFTYLARAASDLVQAYEVYRDQLDAEGASEPYDGDPWAQVQP